MIEPTFIEGWPVRRIADGKTGYVSGAWIQSPNDPDQAHERLFVLTADNREFLSPGMLGEPATAYESMRVMHAPEIERKAGTRYHGVLPSFTSLGSYPLLYLTRGGDTLCADCATKEIDDGNDTNDDPVIDVDAHYEGPDEICAHCNRAIPSACGDPDERQT